MAGCDPARMGIGPVPASEKALALAGLSLGDMDVIELNEAFAAQVLACTRSWGIQDTDERLNAWGGAIALGHPLGASGARILVTLMYALKDRGLKRGLAALCLGGAEAVAMAIEMETD